MTCRNQGYRNGQCYDHPNVGQTWLRNGIRILEEHVWICHIMPKRNGFCRIFEFGHDKSLARKQADSRWSQPKPLARAAEKNMRWELAWKPQMLHVWNVFQRSRWSKNRYTIHCRWVKNGILKSINFMCQQLRPKEHDQKMIHQCGPEKLTTRWCGLCFKTGYLLVIKRGKMEIFQDLILPSGYVQIAIENDNL